MARQLQPRLHARRLRGFSIIELMVGITIALIVTLVIFNVLIASETRKRSTTAVNDINQSGAYSAYVLDRAIRGAGSGISNQRLTLLLGADFESCRLAVTRSGVAVLPRAADFTAPFDSATLGDALIAGAVRRPVLAPVIIDRGTNSDIITVMSGSKGLSEVGDRVIGPSVTGVALTNTFAFDPSDLVLFARNATEGDCVVSQVDAAHVRQVPPRPVTEAVNQSLPLGGTFVSGATAASLVGNRAITLGNATTNRPQFKMYGVDQATNTLVAVDLFNLDGVADAARNEPIAEGIVEMRALYGVDTTDDNVIDSWQQPTGTTWGSVALRDGSVTASANLRRIVAVRIALVLRTALEERTAVPAANSFTVFGDIGAARTVPTAPPANAANFRYRVIETTIPLRNNLL